MFFLGLTILSNLTNALSCISIKNQESKTGRQVININRNNPIVYPFSIKINKCSLNPLYLMINEMIVHFEWNFIQEKNENKHLVLDGIDETKEVLEKCEGGGIKKEIETINSGEKIEYEKDF